MKTLWYLITVFAAQAVTAQTYTLQQCIDSAVRKNIPLRQARLNQELARVNLAAAKSALMPLVDGNLNQGINLGRNIDPFTNVYVNQTINFGSYGVNTSLNLFNGFAGRNNVKSNESLADASRQDSWAVRRQTILNTTLAYLQVLSTQEQLEAVVKQAAASEEQLKRLKLQQNEGVVAVSQVTDLAGQLMNDKLAIVQLKNTLQWYKMELSQHMNIIYRKEMELEKIDINEWLLAELLTDQEIFKRALVSLPELKAAAFRTESARYQLKATEGARYPTIFMGGNFQTVYASSAATATGKINFADQFWNNRFATINLGVRIPIFNGNAIRNAIRQSNINLESTALLEEEQQTEVWRQIERAYVAMTNAQERYRTLVEQTSAYRISYLAATARFETGVDNSLTFLLAKNNLDQAQLNLVNAKYELLLKKKALEYYQQSD